MSICRPAQHLVQISKPSITKLPVASRSIVRCFHPSFLRPARKRRPNYPSLKHDELQTLEEEARKSFPRFSESQWAGLAHHFSPEQIEVLKLAEEAIDPKDLLTQLQLDENPWRMEYADDFSRIDPLLDRQPKAEPTGERPRYEVYDTEDEWAEDFAEKLGSSVFGGANPLTTEETIQAILKAPQADEKARLLAQRIRPWIGTNKETVGRDILQQLTEKLGIPIPIPDMGGEYGGNVMSAQEYTRRLGVDPFDDYMLLKSGDKERLLRTENDPAYSVFAPEIPKFDDPRVRYPSAEDSDPTVAALRRLSLMTGRPISTLRRLRTKCLVFHRVVNQTRMGKIPSFYSLTVAGDGNGLLGIGEGKSAETLDSLRQARVKAIRNLTPVLRYEARTIYGEVRGKVGATEVELAARPPGFGVRCQHLIFEMCRAAGIHDLGARVIRARNPMNTAKATFRALSKQRLPEDIARARGRKLVDVRKVYYAGNVL